MLFFKKKTQVLHHFFDTNFVDIHSHLLPGIDDGAKDLHSAIELIEALTNLGITNFITTPHVLGNVYPNTSQIIQNKLLEVKKELQKRKLNHVNISAAAEYMLDEQFLEKLNNNDILTLKNDYILIEMSYFNPPLTLFDILFEIQLKGYKPILAHPERYIFYHNDFNQYHKLKRAGCLFQLNLLSLTNHYGVNVKKAVLELLNQNLYDFVGTDTHHKKHAELLASLEIAKNTEKVKQLIANNQKFIHKKTV